ATCCFFFQAEDGIRDKLVTGVQTCALPIYYKTAAYRAALDNQYGEIYTTSVTPWRARKLTAMGEQLKGFTLAHREVVSWKSGDRSEERRVGKECRERWWRAEWRENEGEITT